VPYPNNKSGSKAPAWLTSEPIIVIPEPPVQ
jgi:hypothetical protein